MNNIKRFALAAALSATALIPAVTAEATSSDSPKVSLETPIVMNSTAQFSGSAKSIGEVSLKAANNQTVWLNVEVGGMKPSEIKGKCVTVPVGTKFYNEVRHAKNGKSYFRLQKVVKGDQVFCKDAKNVWRKKSCGNEARGLKFTRPMSDKRLIVTGGVVQDYLTAKGSVTLTVKNSGTATASVVQYLDGRKVCEASGTTSGVATAKVTTTVSVYGRSVAEVEAKALASAKVIIKNSTKVQGQMRAMVETAIRGNASASCSVTRPNTPPQVVVVTPPPVIVVTPPPSTGSPKLPINDPKPPSGYTPAPAPSGNPETHAPVVSNPAPAPSSGGNSGMGSSNDPDN